MTTTTVPASGLDVLKAAAKPAAKKSESKTPTVFRPDLQSKCDRFAEVVASLKSLEAEKAMLSADLCAVGEEARIAESRKAGQSLSSVKVNNLTFISQARFSDITDPEQVARVKAMPAMAQHVDEEVRIQIDATKLTPEWAAAIVKLQEAGIATITSALKVKPSFLAERTMHEEVARLNEEAGIKNTAYMRA